MFANAVNNICKTILSSPLQMCTILAYKVLLLLHTTPCNAHIMLLCHALLPIVPCHPVDTLQHQLYMYSDRGGGAEQRRQSGVDTNDREHRRNFYSQARSGAETPGMHQMKPHHRSSPCSPKAEMPGHPERAG